MRKNHVTSLAGRHGRGGLVVSCLGLGAACTAGVTGGSATSQDAGAAAVVVTDGQVLINEIMYHPVSEQADQENHEFVELYNRGPTDAALGAWTLAADNGMKFIFPDGAVLKAGGYAVVAKNRQMLASVYGLDPASVFGD